MICIILNVAVDVRAIKNPMIAEVGNYKHVSMHQYILYSYDNCAETSGPLCTYAATWMVDPIAGTIEVEMIHNRRGWIALGFSDDNRMASKDPICYNYIIYHS